MKCDGHNHALQVILRESFWWGSHVVRWCEECGGVVVDIECQDNRVQPGGKMPMKFPSRLKELKPKI